LVFESFRFLASQNGTEDYQLPSFLNDVSSHTFPYTVHSIDLSKSKQQPATMATLVPLAEKAATPIETDLDGWKKVEGEPTMTTWIEYATDEALCGNWEATVGTYHATYASWEYVHMLEGKIIITPDGGESFTVKAGDAFVVEKDFKGTWKIEEKVLKHFYIKLK
jgi:uncharacterized cupin superfamily protein